MADKGKPEKLTSVAGPGRARLLPASGVRMPAFDLSPASAVRIGRHRDCEVQITDSALSRFHAVFWCQDGAWWPRDENTLNGTTLNGERVEAVEVHDGDRIVFGGVIEYRFSIEAPAIESAPQWLNHFFCLGLDPVAGGAVFPLRSRLTVVGRNQTADLVLDEVQVSGVHARIEARGVEIHVMDSGSRNGTIINGETIRHSKLSTGDEIVFGGQAFRVRRTFIPTRRTITGTAALLLCVVLALVIPALLPSDQAMAEPLWTRQMYLSQVTESLASAVRACDSEPRATEVAQAQFAIARRSLIAADVLRPDRQTEADYRKALRDAAEDPRVGRLLDGRDIHTLLTSLEDPIAPEQPPARAPEEFDLDMELSSIVAQFGIDTRTRPMPDLMREEVAKFIEYWTGPKLGFTKRARRRSVAHVDMIREELRTNRLPEVFCYLPFIESGYQTEIISSAKARGLWQFMPSTGRAYGLRVDDNVDERTDPQKATVAACQYLNSLLNMFGPNAFMCAVAAYNKGENGMARCLKRSGNWRSTWRFWNIVSANDGCLKQETIEYVPRFLAAAIVMRRPEVFGLDE